MFCLTVDFLSDYFIENLMVLSASSPHTRMSVSHETEQSDNYLLRHHSACSSSSVSNPILTEKRNSQNDLYISTAKTESSSSNEIFASMIADSVPIRSHCTTTPSSERADVQNTISINTDWNDSEKENIDWDEPDVPDEGNSS